MTLNNQRKMPIYIVIAILFLVGLALSNMGKNNIAFAEPKGINIDELNEALGDVSEEGANMESLQVQAVLTAQKSAIISGAMDGILEKIPFKNGDIFEKGDILVEYDCRFERAKHREVHAQLNVASRKAEAYERLKENDAVAEVEYVSVLQDYERAKALLEQTIARLALCRIRAPFDGRVTDKVANNHEAVRSGRVLMEISSNEPLQADLLIPSVWLRWLNVGKSLKIAIHETGNSYDAEIKRIHGKVDPVTQTAYVVAQINKYEEELLPGMSGQAMFDEGSQNGTLGFLGIKIENDE